MSLLQLRLGQLGLWVGLAAGWPVCWISFFQAMASWLGKPADVVQNLGRNRGSPFSASGGSMVIMIALTASFWLGALGAFTR